MPEPGYERRVAEENYRDNENLTARQSIWSFANATSSPLDLLPTDVGDRVIDVGCGNGVWLEVILQRGAPLLLAGLDLSAGMLAAARERLGGRPLLQADAVQLPIATGSMDLVLAMWMLYHLDDLGSGIAEMGRVLRPDGTLLAVTVGAEHLAALRQVMTEALCRTIGHVEQQEWFPGFDFDVERAPAHLGSVFAEVEAHVSRPMLTVPDSAPIVEYLTSLRGPAELTLGRDLPWPDVVRGIEEQVDAVVQSEGAFLAEGVIGTFVCSGKRR